MLMRIPQATGQMATLDGNIFSCSFNILILTKATLELQHNRVVHYELVTV